MVICFYCCKVIFTVRILFTHLKFIIKNQVTVHKSFLNVVQIGSLTMDLLLYDIGYLKPSNIVKRLIFQFEVEGFLFLRHQFITVIARNEVTKQSQSYLLFVLLKQKIKIQKSPSFIIYKAVPFTALLFLLLLPLISGLPKHSVHRKLCLTNLR